MLDRLNYEKSIVLKTFLQIDMNKNLTIVTFLGAVTIILGAFAAHSLKETLSEEALNSFQTGVRYQMYHVIVLLFVNLFQEFSEQQKNRLTSVFLIGILLFSGSIYSIHLFNVPAKTIWFVTPLGGVFLIIGWLLMFTSFLKKVINNKK